MQVGKLHLELQKLAPVAAVAEYEPGSKDEEGRLHSPVEVTWVSDVTSETEAKAQAIIDAWVDPVEIQWTQFMDALSKIDGVYSAIAMSPMAALVSSRLTRLSAGAAWEGEDDSFMIYWNTGIPELSEKQRAEFNAKAKEFNVPLLVSPDNTISLVHT